MVPYVAVLAGGGGTRLWPASRRSTPKFLMNVDGAQTLLDATLTRASTIADPDRVLVMTGAEHAAPTHEVAARHGVRVVVEPMPRDTAATLILAATLIADEAGDATGLSMPADHLISGTDRWRRAVHRALDAAEAETVVTIGLRPVSASTQFGYAHAPGPATEEPRMVLSFHEKPDAETAEAFVRSGDYLWNTAIMAWRTEELLSIAGAYAADIKAPIRDAVHSDGHIDPTHWSRARRAAAEPALVEAAAADGRVTVIPASFSWHDVGTWSTVAELQGDRRAEDIAMLNCTTPFVHRSSATPHRRYAVVGLDDLIVVEAEGVTLITDRSHAAQVKLLVDDLPDQGWQDLL